MIHKPEKSPPAITGGDAAREKEVQEIPRVVKVDVGQRLDNVVSTRKSRKKTRKERGLTAAWFASTTTELPFCFQVCSSLDTEDL